MTKKLFLARTSDKELFKENDVCQNITHLESSSNIRDEIAKHKKISIKFVDHFFLYLYQIAPWFNFTWKRKSKFVSLYKQGCEKVEKQMNVIKLLKTLTQVKVIIGSSMMTNTVKHYINHCEENVINLSDTEESVEDSPDPEIVQDNFDSINTEIENSSQHQSPNNKILRNNIS